MHLNYNTPVIPLHTHVLELPLLSKWSIFADYPWLVEISYLKNHDFKLIEHYSTVPGEIDL